MAPSRVFSLECSKDLCQERMISLSQNDGAYQASSILSKRIRLYNENAKKLIPYLQKCSNLKCVNTEQNFEQAFQQLSNCVEPTVLLVRPGGNADSVDKRQQIIDELKNSKDFKELNVHSLITQECERNTEVGRQISA